MKVAICGGGVIGCTLAYYLALLGAEPVVVECTGVANAASGKSGGFLALDWCDGTPVEPLARRSFALHAALAEEHGGAERWGYRRMETLAVAAGLHGGTELRQAWLARESVTLGVLGTPDSTAQITPAAFTQSMMALARERGASLCSGRVTGMLRGKAEGRLDGVMVDGAPLEADAVVIAMGPWSVLASQWLSLPPVHGLKGASIVFRPKEPVPAQALFAEFRGRNNRGYSPEVVPRPDGTVYICGLREETRLPLDPGEVEPAAASIETLREIAANISPLLGDAEILARQACHRPVMEDGLPLMGRIEGMENAFVSTGHSVWGMLNAPASGEAMASLVTRGESELDLSPFDPARLPPLALG